MSKQASLIPLVAALTLVFAAACGDDGDGDLCSGRELVPHLNPVSFGKLYPAPADPANDDPTTIERTPYEWTLQLISQCSDDVTIEKVCLVGDTEDEAGETIFSIEGPTPSIAGASDPALIRIRYERRAPNAADDIDDVAIIVKSNDDDSPYSYVAVCAQVIADGGERGTVNCDPPFEEGMDLSTLCP